jgi:hypothetical protein
MASGLLNGKQSYLENSAIDERAKEINNNKYNGLNDDDEYNENHENAKASSGIGKGNGDAGTEPASVTLPHQTSNTGTSYSRFSNDDAGNSCDQSSRERMMARQLYGPTNQYYYTDANKVDTSANVEAGQYNGDGMIAGWTCPVV